MKTRCEWAGIEPLYVACQDDEWGVPVHDDRKLFEFLILEGAQAMSRILTSAAFSFVGSTICCAFMQAVGLVNDHVAGRFRYKEIR